jgi:sensor histidine kinase YesM
VKERQTVPPVYSPIYFKVTYLKILIILAANTLIALFIILINPQTRFIVSFVFSQCIGISIACCVFGAANFITVHRTGVQAALLVASVIVGAVIGVALGTSVTRFLHMNLGAALPHNGEVRFFLSNLLWALLFGAIVSYVFISLQRLSDEKIKRLEVEKNAVVTEIKLLQSQMEPHFLFNTLSTILSLIDTDREKAKQMLESFTAFLRTSLVAGRGETTTLRQELDVVKNYLDIYSVRMGGRLHYEIDIPDSLRDFPVPPLLIQPLVENAVKHGLEPSVQGGELRVQGRREGDHVRIVVADTGVGINESVSGNSISLENIRKRLDLLYRGRSTMIFAENAPSGLKVTIEIPYESDTSHHSR